jgi:hypothetical protein
MNKRKKIKENRYPEQLGVSQRESQISIDEAKEENPS